MPPSARPSAADQQFVALLVHRGFLNEGQAMGALTDCTEEGSIEQAIAGQLAWEPSRIEYLRRTNGFQRPDIPGYEIGHLLGRGGTSEVFAAIARQGRRRVALKILSPELAADSAAVRAFLDEARSLKDLDHPGLVRFYRVFKFLHTYVLEMDRVAGKTLLELIDEGRSFSEELALDIVRQAAEVLEYLRVSGVQHRDIKPGNLMVDEAGTVVVIDLGFAGSGGDGRIGEGSTLGTPAYLAPEQARGEDDLDVRADIYSLGATLYHIAFGSLPFTGNDREMMRKHVLEGLSGATLKGRGVSPNLHYFIQKMMAKDREVRYPTPLALAADIAAHADRRRRLEQ